MVQRGGRAGRVTVYIYTEPPPSLLHHTKDLGERGGGGKREAKHDVLGGAQRVGQNGKEGKEGEACGVALVFHGNNFVTTCVFLKRERDTSTEHGEDFAAAPFPLPTV
jgi:hypothetical protein